MISWIGKPEQRIISWRHFRNSLSKMPLDSAIKETIAVWNTTPKVNKLILDSSNYSAWPDPWELLSQEVYCDLSRSLGIFYTLKLANILEIKTMEFCIENTSIQEKFGIIVNAKNILEPEKKKVNTKKQNKNNEKSNATILNCDENYNFIQQ